MPSSSSEAWRQASDPRPGLLPPRILVVEDDAAIADYLCELVLDIGCLVLGPIGLVADALRFLEPRVPDAALLDCTLADGSAEPIAKVLILCKVPFAVLTTRERHELSPALAAAPRVSKPFSARDVELIVRVLLNGG